MTIRTYRQELKSLQAIARCFRRDIKLARNKLLAHLDMGAVLVGKPLGEFPEGKAEIFFCALQKLCNITHEACFGTIYGEMSTITLGGGDVINLRKHLNAQSHSTRRYQRVRAKKRRIIAPVAKGRT